MKNMNPEDESGSAGPAEGSRRCRCCIALILALLILGPLAVYPPVRNALRARHGAELVQQFNAANADIPALLKEVVRLDPGGEAAVLEDLQTRHLVIGYFVAQAEAAIDQSKDRDDYVAALHEVFTASQYYPDSAELAAESNSINARKKAQGK